MKTFHLSEAQVARGMRASILDAVTAGPFYNLIAVSGVFFTGLALAMGADNFQIGLFAAVGPLLSGLSLLSAAWLERGGSRKRHYIWTAAVQRGLFLLLLAFPLLPGKLAWWLLGLVVLATIFHYFQLTAWMSWMADMIPPGRRGSFFARRNFIAGGTWMALAYATGRYLDRHKSVGDYALVFSLYSVASLVALHFASRQPDPPLQVSKRRPSLGQLWRSAFKDRAFRKFVSFHLVWGLATNLALPFYSVFMLKNLGLDMARVSLLTVLAGLVAMFFSPWWGHVLDKVGERSTMLFALLGACALAGLWPLLGPANMAWLLPLILLTGGFFNAGVQQSSFNMLLGILPEKNRTSYVALFQAVVGTLGGFAPMLGGWLAQRLDSVMLVITASAVLRVFPLLFVRSMPNRQGQGVDTLVQEHVLVNPFKALSIITTGIFGGGREGK